MELAEAVAATPYRAILVLNQPHVTTARHRSLWESLPTILKPQIVSRMSMVIYKTNATLEWPEQLTPETREAIRMLIAPRVNQYVTSRRKSTAFYDVLRVLMAHWFRHSGPLTSKTVGELTGFSYPTVATSLKRLAPYLKIHSDRRIELRTFPEQPWREFLALSESVRETRRFAGHSGRPRMFETLIERVRSEAVADTAIGGVLGAHHYMPALDIIEVPRLDLTIAASQLHRIDEIMHSLDPALSSGESGEPSRVVVHVVRQPTPLFTSDGNGNRWADEVDCILDLYEARLPEQAYKLQAALSAKAVQ